MVLHIAGCIWKIAKKTCGVCMTGNFLLWTTYLNGSFASTIYPGLHSQMFERVHRPVRNIFYLISLLIKWKSNFNENDEPVSMAQQNPNGMNDILRYQLVTIKSHGKITVKARMFTFRITLCSSFINLPSVSTWAMIWFFTNTIDTTPKETIGVWRQNINQL